MNPYTGKSHLSGQRATTILLGAALVGVFSALYLSTLAPTVLYFDVPGMFDPAMLQAAVPVLGIAHPTGYPTYMMIAHLFTYLPFGDEAYRVNLLSAVCGVAAVAALYLVGLRLIRHAFPAALGALAFGLTPIFWSQAVIAEVYTLNAFFMAAILYALLLWRDSDRDGHLLLAALLMGLSLTHHLTSALLIPVAIIFVVMTNRSVLRRTGLWLKGAGLFALGLTPYLYLPVRAVMEAPLNEADPSTPGRFLLLVSGGSFLLKNLLDISGTTQGSGDSSGGMSGGFWSHVQEALGRLSPAGEYVGGQFPALMLIAGAAGFAYLALTDRAAAALLGVPFAGWTVHAAAYTVEDFYIFFIPAYLIFGLFIAAGAGLVLRTAQSLTARLSARAGTAAVVALCALMTASPLARASDTYAAEDRSGDYLGREILDTVAAETEPGATVLHHRSALWYMVLVEQRRQDLTIIDPFETSWVRHTDIVWPDDLTARQSGERYGTDDLSGASTARIASRSGPVYLLDREDAYAQGLKEAGFRVETVDEEVGLYELTPENQTAPEDRRAE